MNKAQFDTKLGSRIHSTLEAFSCLEQGVEGIPRKSFDNLREALAKTAKATMIEWIRIHEETEYSDLEGNEYDCYLVPSSKVKELEG